MTMGRKLLADPHLPNKLLAEQPETVRPCVYCYTCISNIFKSSHVICAVNPLTGFETERQPEPAERRKQCWWSAAGRAAWIRAAARQQGASGDPVRSDRPAGRHGAVRVRRLCAEPADRRMAQA